MADQSAIGMPGRGPEFVPEIRRRTGFSAEFFLPLRVFPLLVAADITHTSRGGRWPEFFAPPVFFHGILSEKRGIHKRSGGTLIAPSTDKMRFLRRRSAPRDDDRLLAEVLEAEKAAADAIAAATRDAAAWLDAERVFIAHAKAAAVTALAAQGAADEAEARRRADADAATVVTSAEAFSRELRSLGDDHLRPIVMTHLASIIPGPEP